MNSTKRDYKSEALKRFAEAKRLMTEEIDASDRLRIDRCMRDLDA